MNTNAKEHFENKQSHKTIFLKVYKSCVQAISATLAFSKCTSLGVL